MNRPEIRGLWLAVAIIAAAVAALGAGGIALTITHRNLATAAAWAGGTFVATVLLILTCANFVTNSNNNRP